MSDFNCNNCGKGASRSQSYHGDPSGWVWNKSFGLGRKIFCSNRCLDEYNSRATSQSGTNQSNTDGAGGGFFSPEPEKETNEHDVAIEREYTKRRIAENNLSLEKAKLKAAKAEKLRAEGKNVQAFILLHPYLIIGAVVVIILASLFIYSRYVHGKSGRDKEEAIELNAELEKTEMELILGINSKKNATELLELVTKLQHNNTTDFIEGKKYGIIKPGSMNTSGPDDKFFGTYSEYWTGLREAYKEIITKGMSIDDYLKEIKKENGNNTSIEKTKKENKPNENPPTTTNDNKNIETTDYTGFIGEWNGAFGKDKLTINIESVDERGNVVGYDEVKGNRRVLSGNLEGETFVLKEPGDDKWDGVFTFSIKDNRAAGIWTANNGKSTKNFTLTK